MGKEEAKKLSMAECIHLIHRGQERIGKVKALVSSRPPPKKIGVRK